VRRAKVDISEQTFRFTLILVIPPYVTERPVGSATDAVSVARERQSDQREIAISRDRIFWPKRAFSVAKIYEDIRRLCKISGIARPALTIRTT
jgi:hypothetical protein